MPSNDIIKQTRQDMLYIEQQLEQAKATRDELTRELRNARKRLDTKYNGTGYPNRLIDKIIKDLKDGNELFFQVVRWIDNAIEKQTGTEYDKSIYKDALYSVAKDKDIYKFVKSGAGWETKVSIEIVFEEGAGDIVDWAKGISDYRTTLHVREGKEGSGAGLKATSWWLEHVHGKPLEIATIHGRLEASGRKAPFWRILNNGSVSLPSDRSDGSFNPYPVSPTNFIDDAERSCESLFLADFLPEEAKWFEEARQFSEVVYQMQADRDNMSKQVEQLKTEARLNRRVFDSFGEKKRFIDEHKLEEAIRKYRAGEEFERGTIELTAKGSGSRVRTTLTSLIKRVEGYDF